MENLKGSNQKMKKMKFESQRANAPEMQKPNTAMPANFIDTQEMTIPVCYYTGVKMWTKIGYRGKSGMAVHESLAWF